MNIGRTILLTATALFCGSLSFAQTNVTERITNPGFEKNLDGWENNGMQAQSNNSFTLKVGNVYCEKWVSSGNKVPNVYVRQTLTDLPVGTYTLKAVAQNIQQNSTAKQKGAFIFANDDQTEVSTAASYSVQTTICDGELQLGFLTKSCTGNYVTVDDFQLTLEEPTEQTYTLLHAEMQQVVDEAQAASQHLDIPEQQALDAAIQAVEALIQQQTTEGVAEAVLHLRKTLFGYRIATSTGTAPAVTTHPYVAAGATGALGRSTVKGTNILEKGFCWSTEHMPTVLDNRSTLAYENNGAIYMMKDLKPATIYYVRAYAMTKDYAVGYGEEVKVITLPKGNIKWTYDYGADAAANNRIASATQEAVEYYNNWTSSTGLTLQVHYGAGTPTADCSYGGWMRVGPNASYQRTGTILHEAAHGHGIGTQGRWWDGNLFSGGWKGYRATQLVRFFENSTTATLKGDGTHMWPYGINGANEDDGRVMTYIANVMMVHAVHEDGLIPSGHGGCMPSYCFVHEDSVKYYLTSESDACGSGLAYLTENNLGTLQWKTPEVDVTTDDAFAWYLGYDPKRQLYTLRNAQSGRFFSYASGIKTAKKSTATITEYFHLMAAREETVMVPGNDGFKTRGYWIMAGNDVANPSTLTATAQGKTSAQAQNLASSATAQRWFILTADEVACASEGKVLTLREDVTDLTAQWRKVMATPSRDNVEGTGSVAQLEAALSQAESRAESETTPVGLSQLLADTRQAGMDFLMSVSATSANEPFDLTFLLTNPTLRENAEGWTVSQAPAIGYGCAEYFQTSFDLNQTLQSMPLGNYRITVQGFQRPGAWNAIYDAFLSDSVAGINANLYAGTKTAKFRHACADAQTKKLSGTEKEVATGLFIPDNMQAASLYFDKGLYLNTLDYTHTSTTATTKNLKLGVKGTNAASGYWCIFRNFGLYFYGQFDPLNPDVDAIRQVEAGAEDAPFYDLQGRRVQAPSRGLYIRNGRIMLVK